MRSVPGSDGWHARNLRSCQNRLVCPWCSWSWRVVLAHGWAAVVEDWIAGGGAAWLAVLTVRHRGGEALGDVRGDLMDGWSRLRGRRFVRLFLTRWAWALDITLGGPSGPHPHLNVLVLADPAEEQAVSRALRHWPAGKWAEARRPSMRRGVSIERIASGDVAAMTGYAARDASGASFEVVENRYREIRGDGGRILSALAVDAAAGDDDAGRLLRHAAAELVGVRAVGSSAGWRELEGALDVLDPDDVEDILDDAGAVLGWIDGSGWRAHELVLRSCSTPAQLWARCVTLGVRFRRA